MCRAIYLPEDGDKPRFIWLPVEARDDLKAGTRACIPPGAPSNILNWGVPEKGNLDECRLPTKDNPVGEFEVDNENHMLVCSRLRRGEFLKHSILLMQRCDAPKRKVNKSLKALSKQWWYPETAHGPLIIFAMEKVNFPKYTLDLDTTALTPAMDAIFDRVPPVGVPAFAQKVMAVKINNRIDPPSLEQLKIPKRHLAFKARNMSMMGDLLRVPLCIWHYPANSERETSAMPPDNSVGAPFDPNAVKLCLDTDSPDFGRIPAALQADKRSTLVVRPPNNVDLEIDIADFTRVATPLHTFLAPFLADLKGDTPEERLRIGCSCHG